MNVSFKNNTLSIDDQQITFLQPIAKTEETPYGILVTVKHQPGANNRNVYMVGTNGNVLWQIECLDCLQINENLSYVGGGMYNGGLWAISWVGWTVRLAPETGKILERVFTK
jgi:hypothetical protein